jgi:hypothetical protein
MLSCLVYFASFVKPAPSVAEGTSRA